MEKPNSRVNVEVVREKDTVLAALVVSSFGVGGSALILWGTERLSSFVPDWGFLVYAFYMLVELSFLSVPWNELPRDELPSGEAIFRSSFFAAQGFLFFVLGFGGFCHYWNIRVGGFAAHRGGYWDWALYGVSWLLDNGLANMGQIYGWSVSDIRAVSFGARTVVWIWNVLLEAVAVAAILRIGSAVARRLRS